MSARPRWPCPLCQQRLTIPDLVVHLAHDHPAAMDWSGPHFAAGSDPFEFADFHCVCGYSGEGRLMQQHVWDHVKAGSAEVHFVSAILSRGGGA